MMDLTHILLIALGLVSLIVMGVSFTVMFRMMRDVPAIQRAIFLFMRQKFGDVEELLKT